MTFLAAQKKKIPHLFSRFPNFLPIFIFFIGTLFSVFSFYETQKNAVRFSRNYFERSADLRCEIIQDELADITVNADGLKRFFEGAPSISRTGFQHYTRPFSERTDVILQTFWISKILSPQRTAFEEHWRQQHADFTIHDLTPEGRRPVSPERPLYYPVTLFEPQGPEYTSFLGLDLGAESSIKQIFDIADASPGQMFFFPSPWSFEKKGRRDYLIISAVVARHDKSSVSPDPQIQGYTGMIFSLSGIGKMALQHPLSPGFKISIYDISSSPEALLLEESSVNQHSKQILDSLYPSLPPFKKDIPILGRTFHVHIEATSEFLASFFLPIYWVFLPLGILLSFLLALYARRVLLQRQIAEHLVERRTKDLLDKEHHLMTTLQSVGDALITTDTSGRITRMNTVAEHLTGWKAESAVGRHLKDVFHVLNEPTRMPMIDPVEKVLQEGKVISLANHTVLVSKDGKEFPIDDSGAPIIDENKKVLGVVLVFRDVTDARMAARALTESEKKFRTFFSHMNEGVAMHRMIYGRNGIPINYIITDVNPRFEEILGLRREDVIGRLATDAYGTSQPPYFNEYVRCVETGQPLDFTVFFQPLKKYLFVSAISYSPGTFATVFVDVTSTKKAEEALRESEERLAYALDTNELGLWVLDIETKKTWRSAKHDQIFAYPEHLQEWTYSLFLDHILPQDRDRMNEEFQNTIETGLPQNSECRILRRDGVLRWVEIQVKPKRNAQGHVSQLVGLTRDITQRKDTEKAVQDVKNHLERASTAGKVALWEHDLNTHAMSWSGFTRTMLGLQADESFDTFQAWEARVHPDDLSRVKRLVDDHVRYKTPYDITYRMRKSDGTYIWWHDIGHAECKDDGTIIRMSGACVDVTERHTAEDELQKLASIIRYSTELISLATLDGQILFLNEAGIRMLGVDREKTKERDILDFVPSHLTERFETAIIPALTETGEWEGDFQYQHLKTGALTDVHAIFFTILDPHTQKPAYLANISLDITDQKLTEQTLSQEREMLRILIDNIPDSIYVKDIGGRKILANRADLDLMGAKNERDVLGKTDADFYPPKLAEQYTKDDQMVLQQGRPVINREEVVDGTKGGLHWLLTSKLPLKGPDGNVKGLIGIGRDITDRKFLENKLITMAHYDILTSLPNRTLFLEKANTGLAKSRRNGTMCAILFVDLDLFKSVNDTLGHSVGDELLKDTAAKLNECIRESDIIARLGGDEFIIFLNDLEDGQLAQQIAERIREKFNSPRIIAGNDLFITASIGIAVSPNDGETFDDLLKNADTAMYAAKESGRNTFCFFNNSMNQKAVTKMQVERGLRDALLKDELALVYQPIVGVHDGKVRGFEALLRWFRKEGGLIFPDEFIPVAEDTGLIVPIGEWVLYRACQFNKKLQDAGFGNMLIAVNISVTQLRRSSIVDTIKEALRNSDMPAESLEIEVTESILIESFDAAVDILSQIRAIGVRVSLDDFGTGYSSLSHIQHLPITNLKIDRLFMKNLSQESEENDLTPSIIDLAHKLKLGVVAEGVETEDQLKRLKKNNCDYFQGYFLSRPISEDKVIDFLKGYQSKIL